MKTLIDELSGKDTKFTDEFAAEVYRDTYRYVGDQTIDDTFRRVAKALAECEKDKEYWAEQFYKAVSNFTCTPGGRITSNAGTGLGGTTYINCFVSGFPGEDKDSMEGILRALRNQALILKSEGGYGFCVDILRPRGAFIKGIASDSPGAVRMLDMWDTQSDVITSGSGLSKKNSKAKGKIRKGAQMVTMSCHHPDIEEFITAKRTEGKLTKFNMSVLITDAFMEAVEKKLPWKLVFPDYEAHPKEYKELWDGNWAKWQEAGLTFKVYEEYEDANELWELITHSTYTRNEPGVLFVDVINYWNNLYYAEHINATNPCGEQVLPEGGVCLLGSLNLTQFINEDYTNWDYKKLSEIIPIFIRMLDNVNDLSYVPLEEQRINLKQKRRIGMGTFAYGSALMMMKIRYGSEKALQITEELESFIAETAYRASSNIAVEKGSFELFDADLYLESNFVKTLSQETRDLIRKQGIRNSHLLSIQPTGNTSVFANVVSGGLEPVFLPVYTRTSIIATPPEWLSIPKFINWSLQTFVSTDAWQWIKEGDEALLRLEKNGVVFKFDKSRGLLKETIVKDYAVVKLEERGEWDPTADWAATTADLTIKDHAETMKVMSKHIDSAMSKTVNIPNDYPYKDFKNIYMDLYKSGTVKGCTTYREGTMTEVLGKVKSPASTNDNEVTDNHAPKRPKELPANVYFFMNKSEKWVGILGLFNGRPYEVFTGPAEHLNLVGHVEHGIVRKLKIDGASRYDFVYTDGHGNEQIAEGLSQAFNPEYYNYAKMISMQLRHGTPIEYVVKLVSDIKLDTEFLNTWKAGVARMLKRYIKDGTKAADAKCESCGDPNGVIYQEGCMVCKSCATSKCG